MSFLGDLFLGKRADPALPGFISGYIDQLRPGLNQGVTFPHKEYKKNIKAWRTDPASMAGVSLARGAVRRRGIEEDYMKGANRIATLQGGEQGTLLQRMKDQAITRAEEATGLEAMQEAESKYFGSLSGLERTNAQKQATELNYAQLIAQLMMGGQFDRSRKGGLLDPQTIIRGITSAFIPGAGALGGGGGGFSPGDYTGVCWIAAELYGEDERTQTIRGYLLSRAEDSLLWAGVVGLYRLCGRRIAALMRKNKAARRVAQLFFDKLLVKARATPSDKYDHLY